MKDINSLINKIQAQDSRNVRGGSGTTKKVLEKIVENLEQLNEAGFVTKDVDDLENYNTKTQEAEIYATKQQLGGYYTKEQTDAMLATLGNGSYVVAWDGSSEPVVANIPAGVTVTYNGTDYTGTLDASASTKENIYLVGQNMYITSVNDSTYSWLAAGTTELDLSGYATDAELSQLEAKVDDIENQITGDVTKTLVWSPGWISAYGSISSSSVSQFSQPFLLKQGETITIGTKNSNIAILSTTSADSVAVGSVVTPIQMTTPSGNFETYKYTAAEDIKLVACVLASNYTLEFSKEDAVNTRLDKIDNEIDVINEKLDDIDDTIVLSKSGSYYQKIEYDFKKYGCYKVTLKTSSVAKVDFSGLVDASDVSNPEYGFALKVGESILWTPTKDYEALYYGVAGSSDVEVVIYGNKIMSESHIFYCGPTREYTKLVDAINAATLFMDSVLYVDPGEYDLVSEFGDDYFANLTALNTLAGIQLKNRIRIVFSPNAFVKCHYLGDNEHAKEQFSPFNTGMFGFTIENLHLEASNVRYCVHDERSGSPEECQSIYDGCYMSLDNTDNDAWPNSSCIGGGLGSNHRVDVRKSIFLPMGNGLLVGIYYHGAGSSNDFRYCVTITDNYLEDGVIEFQLNTEMQTKDSHFLVSGNNVPNDSRLSPNSAIQKAGNAYNHNVVYEWNNVIRNNDI